MATRIRLVLNRAKRSTELLLHLAWTQSGEEFPNDRFACPSIRFSRRFLPAARACSCPGVQVGSQRTPRDAGIDLLKRRGLEPFGSSPRRSSRAADPRRGPRPSVLADYGQVFFSEG